MENTNFKVYIEEENKDPFYGRLYIEPLERGYGDTLGNALRRLLLSSIKGVAVTAVRIDGVLHEFSTIPGIREDVIEILMNLKHIPIRAKTAHAKLNEDGFKIITIDSDDLLKEHKDFFTRSENPGVITAKDLPYDLDFEFCGNGVLCTMEPGAHLLMEIYIEQGVGYLSAERERPSKPELPIDALLTDAIFSPVKRVNYQIEPARVGQSIDFERLIIEVWTNGAISPEGAVVQASNIAKDCFKLIADTVPLVVSRDLGNEVYTNYQGLTGSKDFIDISRGSSPSDSIHNLELSIRSENCLLRGGIKTIGDLLMRSRDDLLKIRNLGKISLTEIEEILDKRGLQLSPTSILPEDNPEIIDELPDSDDEFASDKDPENLLGEIKQTADAVLDNVEAYALPQPEATLADSATAPDETAEQIENPEEIVEESESVSEPETPEPAEEVKVVETVEKPTKPKTRGTKPKPEKPTKPEKPAKPAKNTDEADKPTKTKGKNKKKAEESKPVEVEVAEPEVTEQAKPKAEPVTVEDVKTPEESAPAEQTEAPKKTKKSSKPKTKKTEKLEEAVTAEPAEVAEAPVAPEKSEKPEATEPAEKPKAKRTTKSKKAKEKSAETQTATETEN